MVVVAVRFCDGDNERFPAVIGAVERDVVGESVEHLKGERVRWLSEVPKMRL